MLNRKQIYFPANFGKNKKFQESVEVGFMENSSIMFVWEFLRMFVIKEP
jgi:hypothetical protein